MSSIITIRKDSIHLDQMKVPSMQQAQGRAQSKCEGGRQKKTLPRRIMILCFVKNNITKIIIIVNQSQDNLLPFISECSLLIISMS